MTMDDHVLCPDFALRGEVYEIWTDPTCVSNRRLVDPRTREDVDTDSTFNPPLSNDELLAIYDYGKGY
jgi:hypothetical protein